MRTLFLRGPVESTACHCYIILLSMSQGISDSSIIHHISESNTLVRFFQNLHFGKCVSLTVCMLVGLFDWMAEHGYCTNGLRYLHQISPTGA